MDRQLRIAMLSIHSSPLGPLGARDTGGMSVYIREVARELGEQGYIVDIFTRVQDAALTGTAELGQNVRLIHIRAGRSNLRKTSLYPYIPEFARNLESFRKENALHYDLIFSHYWLSGCVGEYLKKWWHIPHMMMFHTLGAIKLAIGEKESELRLRAERRLARNCDLIIAPTEREKNNLISYCGAPEENISVIPCGVNLELFRSLPRTWAKEQLVLGGKRLVLSVGRIEPLKGIDKLLQAFATLTNKEDVRLLIVGGDEQSKREIEKLKRLATQLRIQDMVIFAGLVKQDVLPLYYSAADVFVLPSHYESFGLVALEALACGTRVVAADVGDLKNIIQDGLTGYVVTDDSIHALSEKIALALSRTGCEGLTPCLIRATITRFAWTAVAEKIGQECHRLLLRHLPEGAGLSSSSTTR